MISCISQFVQLQVFGALYMTERFPQVRLVGQQEYRQVSTSHICTHRAHHDIGTTCRGGYLGVLIAGPAHP